MFTMIKSLIKFTKESSAMWDIFNKKNNTVRIDKKIKSKVKIIGNNNFIDMTLSHSLFPDFIVDIKKMHDGKYALVSKPTRKESTLKYPVNFKSSFAIQLNIPLLVAILTIIIIETRRKITLKSTKLIK